jgi:hypothetical protein
LILWRESLDLFSIFPSVLALGILNPFYFISLAYWTTFINPFEVLAMFGFDFNLYTHPDENGNR